jgi:hypothetical protein
LREGERYIEMHTKFWSDNLKGRDHLEDLGTGGMILLNRTLRNWVGEVWTGFNWLRIETNMVMTVFHT